MALLALFHPHLCCVRFWISSLLAQFLWQTAYGAVVPHNTSAVLAAWQNCCCYCWQMQYFCPLVLDCLKEVWQAVTQQLGFSQVPENLTSRSILISCKDCLINSCLEQWDLQGEELQQLAHKFSAHLCCTASLCFSSFCTSVMSNLKQTRWSCCCRVKIPLLKMHIYTHLNWK